jgi:predicted transcriptional regulator of viral defense system
VDRESQVINLTRHAGIVRPRDVEALGIPREYLLRLHRSGRLARIGRGLYVLPDSQVNPAASLAEVSKRVPGGVVCLMSALQYYGITTHVSPHVWIAIENRKWEPTSTYPSLRIVRMTGEAFRFGVEEHQVDQVTVRVYSPAKTVADCFKFRSKVGLDVAFEALRETLGGRSADIDELVEAARVCRVARVMRPYLEAMV